MPSNHRILCCSLLLPPSIFPSIRVFSNNSVLHIRWPNYWSFSFSISPSKLEMSNVSLVSLIFLKRSLVFPILLFSSVSLHCSLKSFLPLFAIFWNSAFRWIYLSFSPLPLASLLSSAICKALLRQLFCLFCSWGWFWSPPPIQCYEPPSIVLQALSSDLIPLIYLSLPLYYHKGFHLGHTWMV